MAGGVDEVEDIVPAVVGMVFQPYGARLDGYSPLALNVHVVEKLLFHVAQRDGLGLFENSVRKGGFAVVDMGDDAEISYFI